MYNCFTFAVQQKLAHYGNGFITSLNIDKQKERKAQSFPELVEKALCTKPWVKKVKSNLGVLFYMGELCGQIPDIFRSQAKDIGPSHQCNGDPLKVKQGNAI